LSSSLRYLATPGEDLGNRLIAHTYISRYVLESYVFRSSHHFSNWSTVIDYPEIRRTFARTFAYIIPPGYATVKGRYSLT